MRHAKHTLCSLLLCSALLLTSTAFAQKPPCIPALFNGSTVHFTVVSDNVQGVQKKGVSKTAIPLYAFGEPGSQAQPDVLAAIPGMKGYNPWWEVIAVVPLDGRDLATQPYTSEAEILAAAAAGKVLTIKTGFFFLCQVLPSCDNAQ
ncbi:MAG: hypothetical protein M3Q06_12720 [Bacteroidota bacterium]|nr:hypothetical protein [Bacteroidota bacterium]